MMLQLVAVIAALLLLCTLVLFWFARRPTRNLVQLDQKTLFAEKLQLLTEACERGELSDTDFRLAAQELKEQFLQPLPDARQLAGLRHQGSLLAILLVVVGSLLLYAWTGQYRQLAHWQDAQQQLAGLGERALLGKGEPLSNEELATFALGLRTKLAYTGDDAVAWFVLGRIWLSQGQVNDALDAFEKALTLTPERNNVLISYAQALLVEGSDESVKKAAATLGQVLSREPNNLDALSMLALIASERGDKKEALAAWQLVEQLLPADDPRRASVQSQLAQLETMNKPLDTAMQQDSTQRSAASPIVKVQLTLSAETAAQYAGKTLFVFARASEGRPLPVAVRKLHVAKAGVMEFELTTADSMQPGWDLSAVAQVVVGARISASGSATPDPTDLQVKSDVITVPKPTESVVVALSL